MKLEADLHTHTVASGHAYSTLKEMVEAARQKGLKMLGITDHGLRMPGGPPPMYFANMVVWPRIMQGVEVLRGVEANILDTTGKLDVPEEVLAQLDLVLAGFHSGTGYEGTTVEDNTRAMIAAIKNPYVHIIVHPGNPQYPVDMEKVVLAAKAFGKALEINSNSFFVRPGSASRCYHLAQLAKKHRVMVAVNSDAHIYCSVGDCDAAISLVTEVGIEESCILNSSADRVREFLACHKQANEVQANTNM